METITLDRDITVFYVTAESFPDGILAAHNRLHTLIPFSTERNYFGLSRPENNDGIVYQAATEELFDGEAEKFGCDTLLIQKGNYISLMLHDFRKDVHGIENAFKELLAQPGLDPQGYCVEWYANDTESVKCMIRLQ